MQIERVDRHVLVERFFSEFFSAKHVSIIQMSREESVFAVFAIVASFRSVAMHMM
jgi:hypothetical protein